MKTRQYKVPSERFINESFTEETIFSSAICEKSFLVEVCKTTGELEFNLFHSSLTGIVSPSTLSTRSSGGMEVTVTGFLAISPVAFTLKDSPDFITSVEPLAPVTVAEPL